MPSTPKQQRPTLSEFRYKSAAAAITFATAGMVAFLASAQEASDRSTESADADVAVEEVETVPQLSGDSAFERFRWYGEEIFYSVEVLGSQAARCALSAGYPTDVESVGVTIPVQGLCASTGIFAAIYEFSYGGFAYLDPATMLPVYGEKTLNDKGDTRVYQVRFNRDTFVGDVTKIDDNGSTRDWERYIPSDVHDAISWIYELRTQDLSIGNEYIVYIFDGWKLRQLTMRISDHRDFYTPLGHIRSAEVVMYAGVLNSDHPLPWAADTTVLPPVYTVRDAVEEVGRAYVSLDANRVPVGIEVETAVGYMRLLLDEYVPPSEDFTPDPSLDPTPDNYRELQPPPPAP